MCVKWHNVCPITHCVRGAFNLDLSKLLGFCPNRLNPRSPPRTLGHPKKIDVYFSFKAILSILFFSWKSPIFWVKKVGTGKPLPLLWPNPKKITIWFGLKKLGIGSVPPPPSLGQNPNNFDKSKLKAPLNNPTGVPFAFYVEKFL